MPTLKLVSLVNYFVDLETSLSGVGLGVGWYREARGHWTQEKYEAKNSGNFMRQHKVQEKGQESGYCIKIVFCNSKN